MFGPGVVPGLGFKIRNLGTFGGLGLPLRPSPFEGGVARHALQQVLAGGFEFFTLHA